MNTYVVLLREIENRTGKTPAEATHLPQIPEIADVQVLDIFAVAGMFDAVLICRAPTNSSVARLLNALAGWHTDALLATEHMRFETISASRRTTTH
jgi:uncharacterized protein with GYD domain